jgi:hypothetical protein
VKTFVRRAQKEFDLPIKKMRSDNVTEFKNTQLEVFLDEEGIKHECLGISVSYLTKDPKPLSLHLKLTNVFFLVMDQMSMPTVFSTKPPRVEIAVDVTFDKSNGSQVEQVDSSVVGKEDLPCEAINKLAISDIRPKEDEAIDLVGPLAADKEVFANIPSAEGEQTLAVVQQGNSASPRSGSAVPLQKHQQVRLRFEDRTCN